MSVSIQFNHFIDLIKMFDSLMNAIKVGSISGDISPGTNIKQKGQNIKKFLSACSSYGVTKEELFEVDDLLLLQNIPKVTRCLIGIQSNS